MTHSPSHADQATSVKVAERVIAELDRAAQEALRALRFTMPEVPAEAIERAMAFAALYWAQRRVHAITAVDRAAEEKLGVSELGDAGEEWRGASGTPTNGLPKRRGRR